MLKINIPKTETIFYGSIHLEQELCMALFARLAYDLTHLAIILDAVIPFAKIA
jgi:hypothetical protein